MPTDADDKITYRCVRSKKDTKSRMVKYPKYLEFRYLIYFTKREIHLACNKSCVRHSFTETNILLGQNNSKVKPVTTKSHYVVEWRQTHTHTCTRLLRVSLIMGFKVPFSF